VIIKDHACYVIQVITIIYYIVAMHWMLSPEPEPETCPIPLIQNLLSIENFSVVSKIEWLREALLVSPEMIRRVADATMGQKNNPLWADIRKLRFTASMFGELLRAVSKKRCLTST